MTNSSIYIYSCYKVIENSCRSKLIFVESPEIVPYL